MLAKSSMDERLITKSRLVSDLVRLGLRAGDLVMLHASVKAVGWIVGGPDVVLEAIVDILGSTGTLMMYVGSEDSMYHASEWPDGKKRAYLEELAPYDPMRTRACREWSILTEYLRTWPGAFRSAHPDGSFAAVGALADWITKDHPIDYGYGPGSPPAKLVEARGKVLLLGSPLECVTLLHHAEHLADVPEKLVVKYPAPVLRDGKRILIDIEEFDTSTGIPGYPDEDYFVSIVREFIANGNGSSGNVGCGKSYLFDAESLCRHAVEWLERTPRVERTNPI